MTVIPWRAQNERTNDFGSGRRFKVKRPRTAKCTGLGVVVIVCCWVYNLYAGPLSVLQTGQWSCYLTSVSFHCAKDLVWCGFSGAVIRIKYWTTHIAKLSCSSLYFQKVKPLKGSFFLSGSSLNILCGDGFIIWSIDCQKIVSRATSDVFQHLVSLDLSV